MAALRRAAADRVAGWVRTAGRLGRAGWLGIAMAGAAADAPHACPPPPPVQASTAPARDRGLLWRITRDGRTSWLYGTLHVGKPAWSRLGPRVAGAFAASDVLAVEIDPGDPTLPQALSEPATSAAAATPPALLRARLAQAYERACLPPDALAALHPVLQGAFLTAAEARWLGMDTRYAAEHLLLAQARASGRPVVALETAAQQKAALVPADTAAGWVLLDQSLRQLEDKSGRRVLARLSQAWEGGDLSRIGQYEDWCECAAGRRDRAFLRRLNDDRNPALADGIAAQHGRGLRVFAAVGALHMTGPQALPRLLAQRGFVVERVAFAPSR